MTSNAIPILEGWTHLGVLLLMYLFVAWCIVVIAEKAKFKPYRWGWIPILNIVLLCRIAGKNDWFALLFFIPIVHFYAVYVTFLEICKSLNLPFWPAALMIFPPLNFIALAYIAFSMPRPNSF